MRPGDILAIKYPPGSQDTGHVMIVAAPPAARNATAPLVANTKQWDVPVIDCSKSGHGKTDSRHKADTTFRSGVGRGSLRIYTNHAGEIVGYSWSALKVSDFYGQEERQLLVGRLKPNYQP
jgi:hypothetical protein